MFEDFFEWYSGSDSIISNTISNSLNYVEYSVVMGILAIVAILFEIIRNAVKESTLTLSNQFLVGTLLLFIFASGLKPAMDFIAWGSKQIDEATRINEQQKSMMLSVAQYRKGAELSTEIDSLLNQNGGQWTAGLAYKQLQVWTLDMKMAANLMDATPSLPGNGIGLGFGLSLERVVQQAISGIRALLKVYYIAMMNILYVIIPIAFVFSVFKPTHFLKPLGLFLLYGLVLSVINFIEWVIFALFIEQTVNTNNLGSMIFSTGAVLFDLLAVFLYLRAMYVTRLMVPIPEEDVIGPMVGQAFAAATFFAMKSMKMPIPKNLQSAAKGNDSGTQGPVDITTK